MTLPGDLTFKSAPGRWQVLVLRGDNLLWQSAWPVADVAPPATPFGVHVEHWLSGRGHWVDLTLYCQRVGGALDPLGHRFEHRLVNVVDKFGDAIELVDTLTIWIRPS